MLNTSNKIALEERAEGAPAASVARTWKWLKIDRASKRVASADEAETHTDDSGGDVPECTAYQGDDSARGAAQGNIGADAADKTFDNYQVNEGEERTIVIDAARSAIVTAAAHSKVHIIRMQTEASGKAVPACPSIRANALLWDNLEGAEGAALHITVGEGAAADFAEVILPKHGGAGTIYSNFTVRLAGEGASFVSDAAYMAQAGYTVDIEHTVHHDGALTKCVMRMAGAVFDGGSKVYRGTIDFHKGCKGAKGEETEDVLLLSPTAKNRSLPVILCDEEDVEGEHGATIGRMDGDTLFYINSHGMNEADAIKMICRAKMERVALLEPIEMRAAALRAIDEWFAHKR